MSVKGLNDLIKRMQRLENNLAEDIAPKVNELFKQSLNFSLVDWYNSYDPQDYQRTNNFMNILNTAKTHGKSNTLILSVDSGRMNNYIGWAGTGYGNTYNITKNSDSYNHKKLNASIAFDFFFMQGEHGHGKWMMHQSLPPYMYVDADIMDGFGGRVNSVINNAVEKILKG